MLETNLSGGSPKKTYVSKGIESTENQKEGKTLFNCESFDDFKDWLKVDMEFDPSKKLTFKVTPEFVEKFGETFDDLYPPHLTPENTEQSVFNKLSPTEQP